ncbi:MAG: DUF402 domain-containing protein [Alphaproteobacteria bacterium]
MTTRWERGTQIPARYIYDGKVWFAEAMTVVDDVPERLITYLQVGTAVQWAGYDDATHGFTEPKPQIWHTRNALKIYERDGWCGIWCLWLADNWQFDHWYIDFQTPWRRGGNGLVLKDLSLDIVVTPDLTWRWKDEDHFADRRAAGLITPHEAECVLEEAQRIIKRIEARAAPFSEAWPDWRPDSAWTIPPLPDDWNKVF